MVMIKWIHQFLPVWVILNVKFWVFFSISIDGLFNIFSSNKHGLNE